jgi:hypothetical protein
MDAILKQKLRVAVLIHEQLSGSRCQELAVCLPEYAWNNILQLRRQIDMAVRRGWQRAAAKLIADLSCEIASGRRGLDNALRTLESHQSRHPISTVADIYRDLLALDGEFDEVKIDFDEHELSVATDRIVLEGINLGPFEIRLNWDRLGQTSPYRVVALDPNPAAKSEDITHPHVQDSQLCEGEGRSAVQAALAEGRLFDFFLLVSQILHTYGRGSAYVELDRWDGTPCSDCGSSVTEDDACYCRLCETTLCGYCATMCSGCEEYFCARCLIRCAGCDEYFCSGCLGECPSCRKQFCSSCREETLCESCYEEQQEEEEEDDVPSETTNDEHASDGGFGRDQRQAAVCTVR